MWEIDQIEKDFHQATSAKDIDLMMSLYAPNATMTVGAGETASGRGRDPAVLAGRSRRHSSPRTTGSPITPRTSSRSRSNGDRGTLHFECHFVDVETGEVAATTTADFDVARIDGKWLITNMVGGTTVLEV